MQLRTEIKWNHLVSICVKHHYYSVLRYIPTLNDFVYFIIFPINWRFFPSTFPTNVQRLWHARSKTHISSAWADCELVRFSIAKPPSVVVTHEQSLSHYCSAQCSSVVSCFASLEFNQMKSKCQLYVWMRCWCVVVVVGVSVAWLAHNYVLLTKWQTCAQILLILFVSRGIGWQLEHSSIADCATSALAHAERYYSAESKWLHVNFEWIKKSNKCVALAIDDYYLLLWFRMTGEQRAYECRCRERAERNEWT